jgi:hypothetical protein
VSDGYYEVPITDLEGLVSSLLYTFDTPCFLHRHRMCFKEGEPHSLRYLCSNVRGNPSILFQANMPEPKGEGQEGAIDRIKPRTESAEDMGVPTSGALLPGSEDDGSSVRSLLTSVLRCGVGA